MSELLWQLLAAAESENTPCPWCHGRLYDEKAQADHADYCPYLKLLKERAKTK